MGTTESTEPIDRALVLEPHNDDFIIGMGGTGLTLLEAGWKIESVVMTDGRYGSLELDPEQTKRVRKAEKEREADSTGIEYSEFDYHDRTLDSIYEDESERDEILDRLTALVKSFDPSVIFVPARTEGHPDHRAANRIATDLTTSLSERIPIAEFIVWEIPFFTPVSTPIDRIHAVDVSDQFPRKQEIIEVHESQLDVYDYVSMIESFNEYIAHLYSHELTAAYAEILHFRTNTVPDAIVEDLKSADVTDTFHQSE